jgi:hypothetical protein
MIERERSRFEDEGALEMFIICAENCARGWKTLGISLTLMSSPPLVLIEFYYSTT